MKKIKAAGSVIALALAAVLLTSCGKSVGDCARRQLSRESHLPGTGDRNDPHRCRTGGRVRSCKEICILQFILF